MSDSPEKKSNFKKYLIAAIVALSTPATYLTGLSYYQGILSAYGISSDAFPLATTDIYVQSYFAIGYIILTAGQFSSKILNWCFSTPGLYWISGTILLLITLTYAILKLSHKSRAIISRQNSRIKKY